MMSAKETGNYADDFVDESDSDYSDDFDDEGVEREISAVDKEAVIENAEKSGSENDSRNESGVAPEYPDDFEDFEEEDEQVPF